LHCFVSDNLGAATVSKKAVERGWANLDVGDQGQNAVEGLLMKMGLRPRAEPKDRGEDVNLEFERSDGRWDRLFVQVKSSDNRFRASRSDVWRVRVKANAAARYRRAAHPVILIAVDLSTGECRWDDLRSLAMSPPGAVTVSLSSERRLQIADRDAFVARLAELADRQRARVVPPTAALADEEARLRALDPRLEFRLTANSSGITSEVWPVGDPPVLQIHGELDADSATRVDEHLRYGTPVTAEFRNLSVSGSPVFEEFGVAPTALIEMMSIGHAQDLALGWLDAAGEFQCAVEGLAIGYVGQEGIEIRFGGPGLPLELTLRRATPAGEPQLPVPLHANFCFQFGAWDGHRYRALPWWDGMYTFLLALAGGSPFVMAKREYGRYVDLSRFQTTESIKVFADKALAGLGPIPTVVAAARHCQSDDQWRTGVISSKELERWAAIDRVLKGEVVARSPVAWVLKGVAELPEDRVVPLLHLTAALDLPLMGKSIGQLEVLWRLSNYHLETGPETGQAVLMPIAGSSAHVMIRDPSLDLQELVESCEQRIHASTEMV
jgi:hypothetical protein